MRRFILLLALTCASGWYAPALAQPPSPPSPEKFKVTLRYYIPTARDQHVVLYDAMIRHLQSLDFEFDPPLEKRPKTDREDRNKNYMHGVIAASKARKLLENPVVQTIQLVPFAPDEFKLPDGPDEPVMVRLDLTGNLSPERQRELNNQTRVLLRELGFKEPPGYDHRGPGRRIYTRMVGMVPRKNLDLLLRDLRGQPAGWLGPLIPRVELPTPLRDMNPIEVIEVLPDTGAVKELADAEPRLPDAMEKLSPDLWDLVKGKDVSRLSVRVQIGFAGAIEADDREWKATLEAAAPGFFLEGQFGQYVTGFLPMDQVKPLATAPLVNFIRLPRVPSANVDPGIKIIGDNAKALELSGVAELHKRKYRGAGVRVAIIDRDFRGWQKLVESKQLPAKTRIVDLTTERNFNAEPEPHAGDPNQIGHGTLVAQAAALAAPEAEFFLIRADVADPHHLYDVARYIKGGRFSTTIEQRNGELIARAVQLQARRADLLKERAAILNDFTDESDLEKYLGFLGPFYNWLYSNREWHRQRMKFHQELEEEHRLREERFRELLKDIGDMKDIPIVVNSLNWQSGYPLGATSPLAKLLDDPRGPLWFQSVGNTRGQSWFGLFRTIPGDPAMKFADDAAPLPKGRWSNDVNFLSWQPHRGDAKPDLPEKTRVRITMQWREPHDPDYYVPGGEDDPYRRPLAQVRLQLIQQRDPETKTLPADAFQIVSRTAVLPQRLEHLPGGSVYEHVLETTLDKAGRYAIRVERQPDSAWFFAPHPVRRTPTFQFIEGLAPTGIRPLGTPRLAAFEKTWEFRPRIYVEVLDEANRLKGRVVFADFPTDAGSIGTPADARNVISVGAVDFKNKPQPYSAFGTAAGTELARRPWLYAYDELELAGGGAFGASLANAFAAGTTAAMLTGKMPREQLVELLRAQEGQVLRVPFGKK
jgi:hypothetical protein